MNEYKDAHKASLKDLYIPIGSCGQTLYRSDQSGEVSLTKEQLSMKKREESTENAKPIPMGHQLIP